MHQRRRLLAKVDDRAVWRRAARPVRLRQVERHPRQAAGRLARGRRHKKVVATDGCVTARGGSTELELPDRAGAERVGVRGGGSLVESVAVDADRMLRSLRHGDIS